MWFASRSNRSSPKFAPGAAEHSLRAWPVPSPVHVAYVGMVKPTRIYQVPGGIHPVTWPRSRIQASRRPSLWNDDDVPTLRTGGTHALRFSDSITRFGTRCYAFSDALSTRMQGLDSGPVDHLCRVGIEPTVPIREISVLTSASHFKGLTSAIPHKIPALWAAFDIGAQCRGNRV